MPRRRWAGCPLFSPPGKTIRRRTNHSYPSAPRPAFSARPQLQRSLVATPRRAETNSGCDNANVRTREPQPGKGRRHARLSAGILAHSNQVGERKEKLSNSVFLCRGAACCAPTELQLGSSDPRFFILYRDRHGVESTKPFGLVA